MYVRRNNQVEIRIGPFRGTGKYGYKTQNIDINPNKRQKHRTWKAKQMSSTDVVKNLG